MSISLQKKNEDVDMIYGLPTESKKNDELYHFGVKGMKWGVRRYQNPDGSLTAAGREHYGYGDVRIQGSTPKKSSKNAPKDMIEDAEKVNGGRQGYKYGYSRNQNCAFCAMSYDARRSGKDVQAQEVLRGVSPSKIEKYFKTTFSNYKSSDTKKIAERIGSAKSLGMTEKEYRQMEKEILSEGDNARGIMTCMWKGGSGGHAFNYEVKDGKFYIVDSQVGEVYSDKKAMNYLSNANTITRTRTDKYKINEKQLLKRYSEAYSSKKDINVALKKAETAGEIARLGYMFSEFVVGLPILAGGRIASSIYSKKAQKNIEEHMAELNDKWIKEGRKDWY